MAVLNTSFTNLFDDSYFNEDDMLLHCNFDLCFHGDQRDSSGFFFHILAVCISFEKYLFRFLAHFLIGLFLWYMAFWVSSIIQISPLSEDCKYFSHGMLYFAMLLNSVGTTLLRIFVRESVVVSSPLGIQIMHLVEFLQVHLQIMEAALELALQILDYL